MYYILNNLPIGKTWTKKPVLTFPFDLSSAPIDDEGQRAGSWNREAGAPRLRSGRRRADETSGRGRRRSRQGEWWRPTLPSTYSSLAGRAGFKRVIQYLLFTVHCAIAVWSLRWNCVGFEYFGTWRDNAWYAMTVSHSSFFIASSHVLSNWSCWGLLFMFVHFTCRLPWDLVESTEISRSKKIGW